MKGKTQYKYRLYRIVGTVLDSDKNKHNVTLLTHKNEVVNVKFYSGAYIHYNKTISETDSHPKEESWFKRGRKLAICGFRRSDENTFTPKTYKNSVYQHTVSLIEKVDKDNNLTFKNLRNGQKDNEWKKY